MEPTTRKPSISIRCTASVASTPLTRGRARVPFSRVKHEPRIQKLNDDLVKRGLKPFHVPLGVLLDESDPHKSKCIKCETCDGYPCMIHAKSDAHVICVDPALATRTSR